jgi:UDP-N-acetylmuramoyl-tripeptide--D-alanyl-D-alanine ligase
MNKFSINEIKEFTSAQIIGKGPFQLITSVVINSKEVIQGSLFVALEGENSDGHRWVKEAFIKGAAAALISKKYQTKLTEEINLTNRALLVVEDPLKALQQFATRHVERFNNINRVGITGSCGKSTTKEMSASILAQMGKTVKTPGNFNSQIGLPLALLQVSSDHQFGVFEMGVDHVGEMDKMIKMWQADVALITNIGLSHIGKMGSVQQIAKEKGKLFHTGVKGAYITENSAWSTFIKERSEAKVKQFGTVTTKGISEIKYLGLDGWSFKYYQKPIHIKGVGKHNLTNALAAITIANHFGSEPEQVKEGLENYNNLKGRSDITSGDITVVEDWYNASFDATKAIIETVGSVNWQNNKVAILGSMKELGEYSSFSHKLIAKYLVENNFNQVLLYGKEMQESASYLRSNGFDRNLFYTSEFYQLQKEAEKRVRKGDLVLLKGSRSMAMESLLPLLRSKM